MEKDKQIERLEKINKFMRGRLEWFAENSWHGDESYFQHQAALIALKEFEEELDKDEEREKEQEEWAKYLP